MGGELEGDTGSIGLPGEKGSGEPSPAGGSSGGSLNEKIGKP